MSRRSAIQVGQRYGHLVAVRYQGTNERNKSLWLFACDCGGEHICPPSHVVGGHTRSCGCRRRLARFEASTQHGLSKVHQAEYFAWYDMTRRCLNPDHEEFKNYGARGITICDRWLDSFENFFADMGLRPSPRHSLDRRNNDGPYEPGNCQWATKIEQARNQRTNRMVVLDGISMTVAEACVVTGMNRNTLDARLRRGWSIERVVSTPVSRR